MEDKIMNKKQKSLTNKGFSLVELIIVIAIMAVLVGALAPQYVKYLDKSKISADTQLASSVEQAITVTLMDPDVDSSTVTKGSDTKLSDAGAAGTFWGEVYSILGTTSHDLLVGQLKYDKTTGHATASENVVIQYNINSSTGNVTVKITGGDYQANSKEITIN